MDSRENNTAGYQPSEPTLCVGGCGFFGNPSTNGMCSKCYREVLFRRESTVSARSALEKVAPPSAPERSPEEDAADKAQVVSAEKEAAEGESKTAAAPAPAAKNRCLSCKKKVGLLGFDCRCGGTFCGTHRYAAEHGCGFDFKGVGRDEIEKANPLVRADKIRNKV